MIKARKRRDNMQEIKNAIDEVLSSKLIKAVISNNKDKNAEYRKIGINLKEKSNGEEFYQIEKFTQKQVFHENISEKELNDKFMEFMEMGYR